jgi:flagellar M-ring protein FliF
MPPAITQFFSRFKNFWLNRTMAQRVLLGGLAVTVVVAFIMMMLWFSKADYKVLYSNLYAQDANRVVQMLEKDNIPYQLQDGGKTILVPFDRVYDLRLKVAGEGSLHGQGIGYEIFDEVKIGQTDFVQHVNYQRALQGELSRTITEFPQVDRARVHLVIPERSLFIEEQAMPSASVVLKLKQGEELNDKQVQAIVNLVSMSVENMDKGNITVADTAGKMLYQPEAEGSLASLSSSQLDFKRNMERSLETRVEQMLAPIVGPGRVIARVNADLDFSQRTITKETFDPDSVVVRSEQRTEEQTQGSANIDGGVPEENFRGEGFSNSLSTQQSNRETRTTNFEINKEEHQIVVPVGELDRLSVAVIVDGTYEVPEEGGDAVYVPRTEEELERFRQLVSNAVGFDSARGDTIELASQSFGGPDLFAEQTLFQTIMEYMQRLGKPFLNGLLVFLFLILVVRPVVLALIKPRVDEEEVEEMVSLPEAEERIALEEAVEEEALDIHRRLENAKHQALQLAEQDMDQAVAILKTWMKQEAA